MDKAFRKNGQIRGFVPTDRAFLPEISAPKVKVHYGVPTKWCFDASLAKNGGQNITVASTDFPNLVWAIYRVSIARLWIVGEPLTLRVGNFENGVGRHILRGLHYYWLCRTEIKVIPVQKIQMLGRVTTRPYEAYGQVVGVAEEQ